MIKRVKLLCGAFVMGWPMIAASQVTANDSGGHRQVLSAVASGIQKNHYSPAVYNDELSAKWWRNFLETLDPLKQLFQQADLSAFKKYRHLLDEELRGEKDIEFLPVVAARYHQRVKEAFEDYKSLLQQPFDFKATEFIRPDGSAVPDFASGGKAIKEARRKYVKYLVLQKLVELQAQDTLAINLSQLEVAARQKVLSRLGKWFAQKSKASNADHLFSLYVNSFTHLMDPHTTYMPAADAKKFRDRMSNKVAGIGAALAADDEGAKIARLESTGAAAKAGLEMNDVITRIGEGEEGEMTDLAGLRSGEIANLIRGEYGSQLRLEVKRTGGILLQVSLQRSILDQQESAVKALIVNKDNKKIGYITFPVFYQDQDPFGPQVAADVAAAIQQLKQQQADAILFDLRRNGGGSLQEVTRMVSFLIKEGPVVQVRDQSGIPTQRSSLDAMNNFGAIPFAQQIYDGPLAVMVDEFSASASEIFAAAMQDYKRGVIIGSSSTYGKGTVQRGELLNSGNWGTLNLTIAQFYRVNGASTQHKGVIPDIVLPDLNECVKMRERDMNFSLPWDLIAPASYQSWSGNLDLERLSAFAANRISKDSAFSVISTNLAKSCAQLTSDIPLNLNAYKEMLKTQAAITAENNRALKLASGKENNISILYPIRNEAWLNSVRQDIYIEQAAAIAAELRK